MKKSSPGSPCTTIFSPSSNWTGSSASATVSRSHLSRDSKILKIIKLYYKNTPTLAEDSYLNWQLCHAWFCYKSNISFIQALCTNLQLGNMNVFIHCVLAFSNHPDSNLKSWTGKVGSGSLRLRSDPRCPGLPRPGAAESCLEIWEHRDSLPTSHTRCQDESYSLFIRAAPSSWWAAGWAMQSVHLKDGWDIGGDGQTLLARAAGDQRHPGLWVFEMAPLLRLPAGWLAKCFPFRAPT